MHILIDTNVYSAFKRNSEQVKELFRISESIAINTIVLGELLSGFKLGTKEDKNNSELNKFLENPRVSFLSMSDTTPLFYATIIQQLRKKGNPIPSNDIWIAASAMEHGLMLFSYDSHFIHIEGLLFKHL